MIDNEKKDYENILSLINNEDDIDKLYSIGEKKMPSINKETALDLINDVNDCIRVLVVYCNLSKENKMDSDIIKATKRRVKEETEKVNKNNRLEKGIEALRNGNLIFIKKAETLYI